MTALFLVGGAVLSFAACSASAGPNGEEHGVVSEAITCDGVSTGTSTYSGTRPAPHCFNDPTLTLVAGVDALGIVPTDSTVRTYVNGSITYTPDPNATRDDVLSFMNDMAALGVGAPTPALFTDPTSTHVFYAYDVSYWASNLGPITSLVNQYACNTVVQPGLISQYASWSGGDCPVTHIAPSNVPRYFVAFDPLGGCAGTHCS
jgi:hypothetical protein